MGQRRNQALKRLLILLALLVGTFAAGAADLLEPEQAFRFSARVADAGHVEVRFTIADGYYLYRDRLRFSAEGARLGPAELPAGLAHKDEFFGDMPIYRGAVTIRIPTQAEAGFELKVISQPCEMTFSSKPASAWGGMRKATAPR